MNRRIDLREILYSALMVDAYPAIEMPSNHTLFPAGCRWCGRKLDCAVHGINLAPSHTEAPWVTLHMQCGRMINFGKATELEYFDYVMIDMPPISKWVWQEADEAVVETVNSRLVHFIRLSLTTPPPDWYTKGQGTDFL